MKSRARLFLVLLSLLPWFHSMLLASSKRERLGLTRAYISPRISVAPRLDGVLDDVCWDKTEAATDFALHVSGGGDISPAVRTTTMTCWSGDGLYIAFECEEPLLHLVPEAQPRERDWDVYNGEMVGLLLDVGNDRQQHYDLEIAAGLDGTQYDFGWNLEERWNGGWTCAAERWDNAKVWCMELFVPWEDTRATPKRGDVWAIQILRWRNLAGKEEAFLWSKPPEDASQSMWEAPTFGHLFFGSAGNHLSRQVRALQKRYAGWDKVLSDSPELTSSVEALKTLAQREGLLTGTEWTLACQRVHAVSAQCEEYYWRRRIQLLLSDQPNLE